MRGWFRLQTLNWLTGGAHFIILWLAAQANSTAVWPYALAAMSLVSFAAWVGNYRRLRHISDTPTSKIVSAAQGYVEIEGTAEQPAATPLLSKLTGTPCIWFRHEIYKKTSKDHWSLTDYGESNAPFIIADATGRCLITPAGAEIVSTHKKTWTEGNLRYVEWLLLPAENIYAIGEFATIGGAHSALDFEAGVSALLSDWKQNQPALLQRFDLDQSGSIDLREWALARRQAQREVEARHREIRSGESTNVMRKPADGKLFLVSNYLPVKLRNRYLLWCWLHIAIFLGAGGGAFVLL
jgi:hypothetical protein